MWSNRWNRSWNVLWISTLIDIFTRDWLRNTDYNGVLNMELETTKRSKDLSGPTGQRKRAITRSPITMTMNPFLMVFTTWTIIIRSAIWDSRAELDGMAMVIMDMMRSRRHNLQQGAVSYERLHWFSEKRITAFEGLRVLASPGQTHQCGDGPNNEGKTMMVIVMVTEMWKTIAVKSFDQAPVNVKPTYPVPTKVSMLFRFALHCR